MMNHRVYFCLTIHSNHIEGFYHLPPHEGLTVIMKSYGINHHALVLQELAKVVDILHRIYKECSCLSEEQKKTMDCGRNSQDDQLGQGYVS